MDYKKLRLIKILAVLCIVLFILTSIAGIAFIIPERAVPILMYHSISNVDPTNSSLVISRDFFSRQMQYIKEHDYDVISLDKLVRMMREGVDIPQNYVVLTFDDGYRDFYTDAYPVLKKHGFTATIFLTTGYLGKGAGYMPCISWEEAEELAEDDLIDIGSHTLSHHLLPLLSLEEAREEIFLSKQILEERFRKPVTTFCYPAGALDDSIKEIVKEAGYETAVGTAYQRGQYKNDDFYVLKRVFVSNISSHPLVFRFMLSGYFVPTRELILKVLNINVPRALYSSLVTTVSIYVH